MKLPDQNTPSLRTSRQNQTPPPLHQSLACNHYTSCQLIRCRGKIVRQRVLKIYLSPESLELLSMIKSLRDLTLTLAHVKLYYNRTVLRVIPPPPSLAPKFPRSPQHARARLTMPARSNIIQPSTSEHFFSFLLCSTSTTYGEWTKGDGFYTGATGEAASTEFNRSLVPLI
jgi:hypothetical protein